MKNKIFILVSNLQDPCKKCGGTGFIITADGKKYTCQACNPWYQL